MEKSPISYAEMVAYFKSAKDPKVWEIKKKSLKNRLGGQILIDTIENEIIYDHGYRRYEVPKKEAIERFYKYGGEKFGYRKRYEDWRRKPKGKEKIIDELKKPRITPTQDPSLYDRAWKKIKGFFTPGPSLAEQGARYMKEKHPDRYR
jgi:hypothetical protein